MERPYFSETLSDRRRQLGFSTAQASRVLRLKEEVIIAFEEGDFEAMPKSGYAQGMLSSYARYLGLDAAQIVEMYADELEQWRREVMRHGGSSHSHAGSGQLSYGVGQPYVASRGLLPTSGGPAGDMGSFATTRVRTRRPDGSPGSAPDGTMHESTSGYTGGGYGDRSQGRPYTGRAPQRRSRTNSGARGYDDIQMRDFGGRGYEDDLRIGMDARSYDAATTRRGRRPSRNSSGGGRQRVRGRQGSSRGSSRNRSRAASNNRRRTTSRGLIQSPNQALLLVAVAIVVLATILVVAIGGCVSKNFNTTRTVPVSTATSTDSTTATDSTQTQVDNTTTDIGLGEQDGSNMADTTPTGTSSSRNLDTSVSISVADGAVTWLEITCDGKSDVAETITGPWQHTYTVEDSLTVQTGDTTAVTVVQDGRQVQFDSMASGIGTIRIQGSKGTASSKSSKDTSSRDDTADDDLEEEEDSGSSSNGTSYADNAPSERTQSSKSSSGTSSARMGNKAQQDEDESEAGKEDSDYDNESY